MAALDLSPVLDKLTALAKDCPIRSWLVVLVACAWAVGVALPAIGFIPL
jgi:hypothetical protein